uniref:Uncharacterized protein n=1 Tax=Glossina palpalis gambiensis TaxID=67801 RepID=A0A1B0B5Y2_9MUSC
MKQTVKPYSNVDKRTSSSANTNQKYWTNGINGGLWLHITFLSPYRCLFANKRGHIQNRNSNAFLWSESPYSKSETQLSKSWGLLSESSSPDT